MYLQRLKKLYPSLIELSKIQPHIDPDFYWYQFENKIIGIDKKELTEKDGMLLSTFLTPYHVELPDKTPKEKEWETRIQNRKDQNLGRNGRYRFIFFQIEKGQVDASIFKKTLQAFFKDNVSILWNHPNQGFIIEDGNSFLEEDISYHHIADTFMSELYVKITFLIGPYLENDKDLADYTDQLLQMATMSIPKIDRAVMDYTEAYPLCLIGNLLPKQQHQLSEWILKEFRTDTEALETMHMFIHCNLNVSETAKKLYIHRNSLQYRLDKFYESTGIDMKQFDKAFTVYLAILANMHNADT
ncbi:PucR family transcriptional regulator [Oceanobacillus timonensis]|uniref:PucR family transcriptional regulator n=1 Tax=Oceanobacillus timonensis TaxID=1926285 RepID=UPI001FE4CB95|nr:helix-turn-helix domain-containing protein [Oceanobacillus timonensis]